MKSNWPLLSALRFFLALVVMTGHLSQQFKSPFYLLPLVPFGTFTCVIGFLLVSGYSICHSYFQFPKGFYQRRFDRIYPAFLTAYLLSLVPFALQVIYPTRAIVEPPASTFQLFANVLPIQTIFVKPLMSNNATWTLGVECAFYALAPFLARLSTRRLWWLVGLSSFIHLTAWRWGIPVYAAGNTPLIAIALLWAWLIGWILYLERENIWMQHLAVGIVVAIYGFNQPTNESMVFVTLAGTVLLLLFQCHIHLSARVKKFAVYLGDLSYPLYLVHLPIFFSLKILYPNIPVLIPFLCALLASMIFFHAIDNPLRLRAHRKQLSAEHAAVI